MKTESLKLDADSNFSPQDVGTKIRSTKSFIPTIEDLSTTYTKSKDNNTTRDFMKSYSNSTFDQVKRARLRNNGFINTGSSFFKTQIDTPVNNTYNSSISSFANKNNVMKTKKMEHHCKTVSKVDLAKDHCNHNHVAENQALQFSKCVFNPRTKFDDKINKTFFNTSKSQMQNSSLNYKLEPSYVTTYGKVLDRFDETIQHNEKFRIKGIKRKTKFCPIHPESLRVNNP